MQELSIFQAKRPVSSSKIQNDANPFGFFKSLIL